MNNLPNYFNFQFLFPRKLFWISILYYIYMKNHRQSNFILASTVFLFWTLQLISALLLKIMHPWLLALSNVGNLQFFKSLKDALLILIGLRHNRFLLSSGHLDWFAWYTTGSITVMANILVEVVISTLNHISVTVSSRTRKMRAEPWRTQESETIWKPSSRNIGNSLGTLVLVRSKSAIAGAPSDEPSDFLLKLLEGSDLLPDLLRLVPGLGCEFQTDSFFFRNIARNNVVREPFRWFEYHCIEGDGLYSDKVTCLKDLTLRLLGLFETIFATWKYFIPWKQSIIKPFLHLYTTTLLLCSPYTTRFSKTSSWIAWKSS